MKDVIDSNVARKEALYEKESKEMAEAAYKTIQTLQQMIDHKNN
jgi:hypothetical protein